MGPSVRIAPHRRDAIKRLGFWAVVIGLHGALVLLFSLDRTEERGEAESGPRRAMTVVFLDTPLESNPEKEKPPPLDRPRVARTKARAKRSDASAAGASTSVDTSADTAMSMPGDLPSIDWEHEREVTVQALLPELLKQNQTKCEAERRPGSLLPKCRQPAKDSQWEPEPDRFAVQGLTPSDCEAEGRPGSLLMKCRQPAKGLQWNPGPGQFGIEGLIPFMRLGKRCVVGLGFFGCAIGKLPEPNGHLFDEMRNPNREHSSVPEIDRQGALDP